LAEARLFVRTTVTAVLPLAFVEGVSASRWLRLEWLQLLQFPERRILLEIGHLRWVIVSRRVLVCHESLTHGRANRMPDRPGI
jgi:hypothetical protein